MLSPFAVERGTTFELLTRLPDARGAIHDVTLTIEGRSCVEQPAGGYRVGGALDVRDAATRSVLIEFCYVVLPQQRLAGPTELPELPAKVRLRTARAS
jgi:hypothetical protein